VELTQCAPSRQVTACLLSVGLRIGRKYLNLKLFNPYSFKECKYLLIKILIQIFSLIFLKISRTAVAQQPLWRSHLWNTHNRTDRVVTDRAWHSTMLEVPSFMGDDKLITAWWLRNLGRDRRQVSESTEILFAEIRTQEIK